MEREEGGGYDCYWDDNTYFSLSEAKFARARAKAIEEGWKGWKKRRVDALIREGEKAQVDGLRVTFESAWLRDAMEAGKDVAPRGQGVEPLDGPDTTPLTDVNAPNCKGKSGKPSQAYNLTKLDVNAPKPTKYRGGPTPVGSATTTTTTMSKATSSLTPHQPARSPPTPLFYEDALSTLSFALSSRDAVIESLKERVADVEETNKYLQLALDSSQTDNDTHLDRIKELESN